MASSQNVDINKETLRNHFKTQEELYDLHTHLLGMGDDKFWINEILMKKTILPTNVEFKQDLSLRQKLCRLVWDSNTAGFIHGGQVDKIIQYLIDMNYPNGSLEELKKLIQRDLPNTKTVFHSIAEEKNRFERELKNRGLAFKENFSYDVILKLDDLANGLNVNHRSNDFIQAAIEEKLCFHIANPSDRPKFCHWIIFNARMQCFEVAYGITVDELRKLIHIDATAPRVANQLARGHIQNAFSMRDARGKNARPVDLHGFQGMFTPEFYPRRFALKDSIYSQRLDVLARLLYHVLHRYDTCHPRVTYCELSVGVGDLTRAWVFDVLCSFHTSNQISAGSSTANSHLTGNSRTIRRYSFCELLLVGHFPNLKDFVIKDTKSHKNSTSCVPKCIYKFLAGFGRHQTQTPFFQNQKEAIDFLNEAPQMAIHLMLKEINKSARDECITEKDDVFYRYVEDLKKVKESARKNSSFHNWVVGFDLFGDEMGFPYCPFVARDFINYILETRKKYNLSFGLRIHCGENVPFADANTPAYRHFAAHMYIAFRCLRYLQHEIEYGIRVGHGIAFQRILDGTMSASKHRKSSVLLAEIEHHARHVFKTIAFEVNITSNEYLLGHALRNADVQQALKLDALLKLKVPIILATDNDGIWPIDKCLCGESSHFSLSGECCRAISTEIIKSLEDLKKMFENMKTFRFYSKDNTMIMPKADIWMLPNDTKVFTVIIHPDIIKFIIERCGGDHKNGTFYDDFWQVCESENTEEINNRPLSEEELESWNKTCRYLAPIAYVSYCARNSGTNPHLSETLGEQYGAIFENRPVLAEVLKEWKSVYQQLIEPNIIDQSQCVSTNSTENVFFSEGPLTAHKDKTLPMKDLIDFLQRHYHYHKKISVHAFTRHINVEATILEIEKQLKRQCNADLHVSIYSNKDKEKYEDFDLSKKIQLQINQTPLERTDRNGKQQQNGLYAICPHASAATAFLHLVSKELSTDENIQTPATDTGSP